MNKIAYYKEKIYKQATTGQENNNNTAGNVATGAVGAGMIHASKDKILGQKTLYHGTSKKNWESIKNQGLQASKGGSGAAKVIDNADYIKGSTNKVHLTGSKMKAKMYSGLEGAKNSLKGTPAMKTFEALKDKHYDGGRRTSPLFDTPEEMRAYRKASNKVNSRILKESMKKKNQGKVVKVKMNYDKYKKMEIDPDEAGGMIMEGLGDKIKNKKAKGMVESFAKHQASRGNIDVGKDEIVGLHKASKRLKNQIKYMPKYIKNNKARFGIGVALAGTGGALLGNAIKANKKEE